MGLHDVTHDCQSGPEPCGIESDGVQFLVERVEDVLRRMDRYPDAPIKDGEFNGLLEAAHVQLDFLAFR